VITFCPVDSILVDDDFYHRMKELEYFLPPSEEIILTLGDDPYANAQAIILALAEAYPDLS